MRKIIYSLTFIAFILTNLQLQAQDVTPPVPFQPQVLAGDTIRVIFNEPVNTTSVQTANYSLNPSINILNATRPNSADTILLKLAMNMQAGVKYTLSISNIQDTAGNTMAPAAFDLYYNPLTGGLVISEIFYSTPPAGMADSLEFIEIYNASAEPIALGGIEIRGSVMSGPFAVGTLAPGSYFTVAGNGSAFQNTFGFAADMEWMSGALDGVSGDSLVIVPAVFGGWMIDSVVYETGSAWPAVSGDASIEICNKLADNNAGSNWQATVIFAGTFGADSVFATPGAGCGTGMEPVVSLPADGNFCGSSSLLLDAGNPGAVYYWSTGDTTQSITVTASGVYSVTVNNGYGVDADTINLALVPGVSAGMSIPAGPVCPNQLISFVSTSAGATQWQWHFGDGQISALEHPQYAYEIDNDTVTVTHIAINNYGCRDTVSQTLAIRQLEAVITLPPDVICAGQQEIYSGYNAVNAVTWRWDFGDGSTSTLIQPPHTYAVADTYNIRLAVTSPEGCKDTTWAQVVVDICTGTGEALANEQIQVYPNPAKEVLFIEGLNEIAGEISVHLFDRTGKSVLETTWTEVDGPKMLETGDLPAGIYFLKIASGSGMVVKKVMVE